jgi:peroxiredoxin
VHKGITLGEINLVSVEERGTAWVESLGAEADRYFDAVEFYESSHRRAKRETGKAKSIFAETVTKLEEARAAMKTPVFQTALDERLTQSAKYFDRWVEEAERVAAMRRQPMADWQATDLDGKVHRLADLRGKVVIMDFWYRGCGWCMTAMPQVNRLAETFRNDPVQVLAMSTDTDETDSRVVVDAMGLKYPVLKAAGVAKLLAVEAFPTLIVVDKSGKIREFHVGYSPQLYDEISQLVRQLVAEAP